MATARCEHGVEEVDGPCRECSACPKSEDGQHELFPRHGDEPQLYQDPILGWGADVRCVKCLRLGFVRLDFDNVHWDEEEDDDVHEAVQGCTAGEAADPQ